MLFTSSKCREFSPCSGVVIPLYLPLAQGPFHASCHVTRLSPRGLDQTPVVSMRGGRLLRLWLHDKRKHRKQECAVRPSGAHQGEFFWKRGDTRATRPVAGDVIKRCHILIEVFLWGGEASREQPLDGTVQTAIFSLRSTLTLFPTYLITH